MQHLTGVHREKNIDIVNLIEKKLNVNYVSNNVDVLNATSTPEMSDSEMPVQRERHLSKLNK